MSKNINNLADLLGEFRAREIEILQKQNIKHPPTIGRMYEGLTARMLEMSLFEHLDLKVAKNSFVEGCKNEFDIILAEGEGSRVPHTDSYVFRPENVLAIVQVKKNLYSNEIVDCYQSYLPLFDLYREYFKKVQVNEEVPEYWTRMYCDSIRSILRKEVHDEFKKYWCREEKFAADAIAIDIMLPIRIVLGYNGFKSEFNFRESYVKYLASNMTLSLDKKIEGFGVHNYPNLMISSDHSLIKANGMPFAYPLDESYRWLFYSSSSFNPSKFLLEIIWTRLQYKYDLPTDIFGDDLLIEPSNPYIAGKIQKYENSDSMGWSIDYIALNEKELEMNNRAKYWEPCFLDDLEFGVVSLLLSQEEIDLNSSSEFKTMMAVNNKSIKEFLEKFLRTGLVYIQNSKLRLLTDFCQAGITPDGRKFAAENKSGRLTNWYKKFNLPN